MIHAFGRSAEEEYKDGIHELSDVSCVARTHASVHLFHPSVHFSRLDCTRGAASKKKKKNGSRKPHYSVSNPPPIPFFFLSWLVQYITGNVGILFTNREKDDVVGWFEKYGEADFARSGDKASETVTLSAGPLPQFPHSIEPHLRKLGLATSLQRGVVMLLKDTVVCTKGAALSPSEANILKLLGITMAEFHVTLTHAYNEADGVSFLQGGGGGAASA